MMITSIQIRENVKNQLDRLKTNKETYEQIIINLMKTSEECKRRNEDLLIEGCKVMAKDMLEINKEWEQVDADIDWEWNDNKK